MTVDTPKQMPFSNALLHLKEGWRVARQGWNGKGMFIRLVPAEAWDVDGYYSRDPETGKSARLPWIGMFTADKHFVPWLASQTDILAEDWVLLA